MISHEHRCIFIHQRKCAGASICLALGVPWSRTNPDWHFMNDGVNGSKALTAPPYFRFSIVRNPYDRFISGWKFCEREGSPVRSLIEVLRDLPRRPTPLDDPDGAVVRDYVHVTRPQHEILFRRDESLGIDFLMRFENLQPDFDRVCSLVGKPRTVLPLVNKGDRLPYRRYFDPEPEARRLLEKHFQRDLELFDYHY